LSAKRDASRSQIDVPQGALGLPEKVAPAVSALRIVDIAIVPEVAPNQIGNGALRRLLEPMSDVYISVNVH
jgi:hypothetical protein